MGMRSRLWKWDVDFNMSSVYQVLGEMGDYEMVDERWWIMVDHEMVEMGDKWEMIVDHEMVEMMVDGRW